MYHAFFYEAFAEEADALRRFMPPHVHAGYTDRTIQESHDGQPPHTPPAKLISIRTQSRIPVEWAASLDAVLSRSTGYDHLLAYAAAIAPARIALGYLPLYCHRAVAEQAMTMWMMLLRRMPRQLAQFASFHRDGLTGAECAGRTLVVVGVGHIGAEVCRIGKSLGMRVLGVDRVRRFDDIEYAAPQARGCSAANLRGPASDDDQPAIDAALAAADVVVCAMDLNASNAAYFDAARIARIKRGSIFVNIARGELSPSTALLDALKFGHLAGVGLDTFNHEPDLAVTLRTHASSADPEVLAAIELSKRDDAICTPHNAFNTVESVDRKSDHSAQQVAAYLASRKFLWSPPELA